MPKVSVYDMSGAQVGELELNDSVFGIEPNVAVLHSFVKMQLANKRVGTSSTKRRGSKRRRQKAMAAKRNWPRSGR